MRDRGQDRFLPLLIALGGLFLLYPLMVQLSLTRLFRIVFILVLVVAVYALGERRRQLIVALVLAVPGAIAQAAALARPSQLTLKLAVVLALLFITYVTVVVLRAVLKGGRVTGEKIAGAVCGYLLLGLAWAMAYALIDLLQPGAFTGSIETFAPRSDATGREYGFIYYSFVTLTTLGYGDVAPVSAFARTVAWAQAVTGQLYVAILVARLVALQIVHGGDPLEEE